jgi:hypothetical protein
MLFAICAAVGWLLALLLARKAWKYRGDCQIARNRNASLSARLAELGFERDRAAKLAQERFELIEGVLAEKQTIWRMYRESTRQAGVAQDWLLREYSAALRALNTYRRRAGESEVKAPAQLTALLAEFGETASSLPEEPPRIEFLKIGNQ